VKQTFSSIDTVIIGEVHGVVENVKAIQDTIALISPHKKISCVAFEYPRELLPIFEKALRANDYVSLITNKEVKQLLLDGRFSKGHFDLIFDIYNKKVKLLFIDCLDKKWDYRDRAMFEMVTTARQFLPNDSIILCIVGNLHSAIETEIVQGRPYLPLGSHFDSHMLVVYLKYLEGSYLNGGVKSFHTQNKDIASATQFEEVSENRIEYNIPVAHALESPQV
jgi:hypothetical protein